MNQRRYLAVTPFLENHNNFDPQSVECVCANYWPSQAVYGLSACVENAADLSPESRHGAHASGKDRWPKSTIKARIEQFDMTPLQWSSPILSRVDDEDDIWWFHYEPSGRVDATRRLISTCRAQLTSPVVASPQDCLSVVLNRTALQLNTISTLTNCVIVIDNFDSVWVRNVVFYYQFANRFTVNVGPHVKRFKCQT